jgi:hypothetical protein
MMIIDKITVTHLAAKEKYEREGIYNQPRLKLTISEIRQLLQESGRWFTDRRHVETLLATEDDLLIALVNRAQWTINGVLILCSSPITAKIKQ